MCRYAHADSDGGAWCGRSMSVCVCEEFGGECNMSDIAIKMDEGEILREYRTAKNPREQIRVLADLNAVTVAEMTQWLIDHGEIVDGRVTRHLKPKAEPDQTAKADAGKPRLSLVPMRILWAIAEVREYGNRKYKDPDNWKRVEPERYREALLRHILRYIDDPDGVDDESGLPHLWHAATNIAFLIALTEKEGK